MTELTTFCAQLSIRYGCNDRTQENCIITNRPDLIIIHPEYR